MTRFSNHQTGLSTTFSELYIGNAGIPAGGSLNYCRTRPRDVGAPRHAVPTRGLYAH